MRQVERMTRRELLKSATAAAPALALGARASAAGRDRGPGPALRMNVVLFMTDQERKVQHFPPGWAERNLPGLNRLKQNGLSFENAFTNSCMCSPARSTWLTGYFPAQHGVKYTLEEDMSPDEGCPQVELPVGLANIATVMSAAGYNVVYKGKWHCSKPAEGHWTPSDLTKYGFHRWDPPDAGADQRPSQAGGGRANHDHRFMYDHGPWQAGQEGAIPYIISEAAAQQPFFLIVSLVNPHDVLFYPTRRFQVAGYDDAWLRGDILLPATVDEDLSTKPIVQQQFLAISSAGLGPLQTPEEQRNYLNFYGNLMKSSDRYLVQLLDVLEARGLLDDTLIIRTADHGEMGMTHGGQRQKNFNFYEESLRIPLIYSNRKLYGGARASGALVSHVDFLPTIASLFGAPAWARANWQGVDYSRLVLDPSAGSVQDYIVFTFDDYQSGQASPPYPTPPNHVVSIREERYKLAEYYDVDGVVPSQWEMYDLQADPLETNNIAYRLEKRSREERRQFERLRLKLAAVRATRLRPLG